MTVYPKLKTLPDDNVGRVVLWYGPVIKNPFLSEVPLVEIITRTIQANNTLSEQSYLHRAPASELDIVKIGSIWQGRTRMEQNWGSCVSQEFSFDFSLHEPESIHFNDRKPGSNEWQVPPYIYNLGNIPQAYRYHFFNSTLTKLTTASGTTVLIPSLEFLTGAVSPAHKQIRFKLLQYPLDELTNMYIQESRIADDGNYVVRMKDGHFDENISLLTYLRLNHTTRKRISRLWTSVEKTRRMPNGKPYEDRYPEVLPYHPTAMSLAGEWLWIDDSTFLMLRITGVSQPQDFHIENLKTVYDPKETDINSQQDPEKSYPPSMDVDLEDQEIIPENDPHWIAGIARIKSGVTIIGQSAPITINEEHKEVQNPRSVPGGEDQETTNLSSGDPNNREESNGTAALKQNGLEQDSTKVILHGLIKETIDALNKLVEDENSEVKNIYYIGNKAQEALSPAFCSVNKAQLSRDYTGRWHIAKKEEREGESPKYILRKFLVIKIELKDGKSAYLVEIERKSKSESFSGLLFSDESEILTVEALTVLLTTITENKGRYHTKIKSGGKMVQSTLQLPISKYITFKHLDVSKTLKNAIKKAKREEVFI